MYWWVASLGGVNITYGGASTLLSEANPIGSSGQARYLNLVLTF